MKKLIVIILITVTVCGIGYFILYKNTPNNVSNQKTNHEKVKPSKTIQMQSAEHFITTYIDCVKKPGDDASGKIHASCFSQNKYAGQKLEENLEKQNTSVFCGQTPPKSITAKRSTEINKNQAIVILQEDLGTIKKDVMYQMQLERDLWKVVSIFCNQ